MTEINKNQDDVSLTIYWSISNILNLAKKCNRSTRVTDAYPLSPFTTTPTTF